MVWRVERQETEAAGHITRSQEAERVPLTVAGTTSVLSIMSLISIFPSMVGIVTVFYMWFKLSKVVRQGTLDSIKVFLWNILLPNMSSRVQKALPPPHMTIYFFNCFMWRVCLFKSHSPWGVFQAWISQQWLLWLWGGSGNKPSSSVYRWRNSQESLRLTALRLRLTEAVIRCL